MLLEIIKILKDTEYFLTKFQTFPYHALTWCLIHGDGAAPQSKNAVSIHFRSHTEYFLLSWKIFEVISRRSILFHKWREYLLYDSYVHTTFYYSSGLTRNLMFNGSILFFIFVDAAFLLCGAEWSIRLWLESSTCLSF